MKRDVLTVVIGSALTIFLDLIVRVVIHTFLGVLMYCIRYFVSSSITGLCLDSGAGLMECGAAGRDQFEFDRCVLRVNETDDFAASLSVLVFGMLFCRYTLLPKSPPGVRHRNMRQASCSSLSTTSHISQVHSYPCDVRTSTGFSGHSLSHPKLCPPNQQVCLVPFPCSPLLFSYSTDRLRLIQPHLRIDSRSARPTTTRLFKQPACSLWFTYMRSLCV